MTLLRRSLAAAAVLGLFAFALQCTGTDGKPILPEAGVDAANERCGALAECAEGCVDLQTSLTDCGACGRSCAKGETCTAGSCRGCAQIDADGDGENACTDCNDQDPLVNHAAFDAPGNGLDDDCNGTKDDVKSCEGTPSSTSSDPSDYAHAMELCAPELVKATLDSPDPKARQVAADFGIFQPRAGARIAAFSTGVAAATNHGAPSPIVGQTPQLGTDLGRAGDPYPGTVSAQSCPNLLPDPPTVNDLTSFVVTLTVPSNARSFLVDLNFLTSDAPEWPCSEYDDQALVVVEGKLVSGNVLLDTKGHRMGVNHGLVLLADAPRLSGTGFDGLDGNGQVKGAATGWITLQAPVFARETLTLRFHLFDAKDAIYDSVLLLDHFRWSTDEVKCAKTTSPYDDAGLGGCANGAADAGSD
jgi:hypothetical protein